MKKPKKNSFYKKQKMAHIKVEFKQVVTVTETYDTGDMTVADAVQKCSGMLTAGEHPCSQFERVDTNPDFDNATFCQGSVFVIYQDTQVLDSGICH
jgi:hypothetical protein